MHKSGNPPTKHRLDILDDKRLWGHLPTTRRQLEGTEEIFLSPCLMASRSIRHNFRKSMQIIAKSILHRKKISHAYSQIKGFSSTSNALLMIVPTQDEAIALGLFLPFQLAVGRFGYTAILRIMDANSVMGGQPYGLKAGVTSMSMRAGNVLIDNMEKINDTVKRHRIRALFMGSIENYIDLHASVMRADGVEEHRAVDYGAALYFNPATGFCISLLSNGVTVPVEFLKAARSFGYYDRKKTHGKVTVSECIHFKIPEIPEDDWQKTVLGRGEGSSRFDILGECINRMVHYYLKFILGSTLAPAEAFPEQTNAKTRSSSTSRISRHHSSSETHEMPRSQSQPRLGGFSRRHHR